jgi:hypothetical protein
MQADRCRLLSILFRVMGQVCRVTQQGFLLTRCVVHGFMGRTVKRFLLLANSDDVGIEAIGRHGTF